MRNIILKSIVALSLTFSFTSCEEEKLGESIFDITEGVLDPSSATYNFDYWLKENYLKTYNMDFRYKLQDVGADMSYNLVPVSYRNGIDMAILTKFLWLDAYLEVAGIEFMKEYGPRIIHIIGSPAYNPANGTMVLGLAEGGIKVTLYRANSLDYNDIDMMNEFYFKTMHHEFAHILHQTKTYPREFNLLSQGLYDAFAWQDRDDKVALSMGFASNYGSSAVREDFVEIIANYIVKDDATWADMLETASKGWNLDEKSGNYNEGEDKDGVDGKDMILQKLDMCRTWLMESFKIDLDKLRESVQYRQSNIDMEELRSEVENSTEGVIEETGINK